MEATASVAEIAKFKVDAGDVVITKDSETPDDIGIPAVIMDQIDNLVCGYHLALLKTRQEFVDPVFLCKQLGSHVAARYFGQRAAGSTRYGLSNSALARFPVSLPTLPQQKRIAAVLSCIDTAVEKAEALIAKYQQINAGLMHDLFTRGVLPNGQLRPPREGEAGMSREATTFYEHIVQLGFASGSVNDADKPVFRALMETTVETLQETIASIDFWHNPDKQKRVRGLIKTEIAKTGIEELKLNRERVAVEIMKLAKNRHDELIKSGRMGGA